MFPKPIPSPSRMAFRAFSCLAALASAENSAHFGPGRAHWRNATSQIVIRTHAGQAAELAPPCPETAANRFLSYYNADHRAPRGATSLSLLVTRSSPRNSFYSRRAIACVIKAAGADYLRLRPSSCSRGEPRLRFGGGQQEKGPSACARIASCRCFARPLQSSTTRLLRDLLFEKDMTGRLHELLTRGSLHTDSIDDSQAGGLSSRKDAAADEMARLQEISTLLIREGNVAALYERVLDGAISLMSADMGSIQVFDRERGELKLIASRGLHPESVAFWEWVRPGSHSACGQSFSSRGRVIVSDVETCAFMAGTADIELCRRSGVRAVQSTPLISRSGPLLGIISTHWGQPHQPSERALLQIDVLARQAADLIERSQAETELRQSEERCRRLAEIVESSDDAIISTDLSAIISTWNKGAERLYGYTAEEIIGAPISTLIPPDRRQEELAILAGIKRGERAEARDTVRRRKDGTLVDVLLTVSLLKNAAGDVVGGCSIVRDITDRKRLERNVQLLSRELDHRAKNMLALVQATVRLSNADTTQELKAVIERRIHALSQAHPLLAETRCTGADLAKLVEQELSPYCSERALQANVSGPEVRLTADQAQPLALLLHELTTNAVKYGALSLPSGRVRVVWTKTDDRVLLLQWIEQDGPSIEPPQRRGFGMRVIEEVVRRQFRGEVRFDWAPDGLTCRIVLPHFSHVQDLW